MGQIQSPYKDKKPDLVDRESGKAFYGEVGQRAVVNYEPQYNARGDIIAISPVGEIIDVPLNGETVDLHTGESDSKYWQPDVVFDPHKCAHVFSVTHVGKREIECMKCLFSTTFNVGVTFHESAGVKHFWLHGKWYPVQ